MIPCDHSPIPNEFHFVTALKIYSGDVSLWDEEFDVFEGFEMEQECWVKELGTISNYPAFFRIKGLEYAYNNNPGIACGFNPSFDKNLRGYGFIRNTPSYEKNTVVNISKYPTNKFTIKYCGGYTIYINSTAYTQPAPCPTPILSVPCAGVNFSDKHRIRNINSLFH